MFRINGTQFAGPTQILPLGVSHEIAQKALAALQEFLKGGIPAKPVAQLGNTLDAMKWREYRTSTKHLLVGLANSIQQVMPEGWSLQACCPENALVPCPVACSRRKMSLREKDALGLDRKIYRGPGSLLRV